MLNNLLKPFENTVLPIMENAVFFPFESSSFLLAASVKDGVVYEGDKECGWGHFLEHVNLQQTALYESMMDMTLDLESVGGRINAFTERGSVTFSILAPSWALDKSFAALSSILSFSSFSSDKVESEKQIILQEAAREKAQGRSYYTLMSEGELLKPSKSARYSLGTPESLTAANSETLSEYKRSVYTKQNVFLTLSGAFDRDKGCRLTEDLFNSLPDGKARTNTDFRRLEKYSKRMSYVLPGSQNQVQTVFGFRLDEKVNSVHASIFNTLVGAGFSSLFYRRLRNEHKLTYTTATSLKLYPAMGTFRLIFAVDPKLFEKAEKIVLSTIDDVASGRFSDSCFDAAKKRLWGSSVLRHSNAEEYGIFLNKYLLRTGRGFDYSNYRDELSSVPKEEISSFAEQYINEQNSVVSVIGSEENTASCGFSSSTEN